VSLRERLRDESGQELIASLLLLSGALLPLLFLIAAFARIEHARLATAQAARDAVRVAVEAPSAAQAQQAAEQALARAQAQSGMPLQLQLQLQLDGTFGRGQTLRADTSVEVALGALPFIGSIGSFNVHSSASAPVDAYRSLPTGGSP
jgi:hypothetical protein